MCIVVDIFAGELITGVAAVITVLVKKAKGNTAYCAEIVVTAAVAAVTSSRAGFTDTVAVFVFALVGATVLRAASCK